MLVSNYICSLSPSNHCGAPKCPATWGLDALFEARAEVLPPLTDRVILKLEEFLNASFHIFASQFSEHCASFSLGASLKFLSSVPSRSPSAHRDNTERHLDTEPPKPVLRLRCVFPCVRRAFLLQDIRAGDAGLMPVTMFGTAPGAGSLLRIILGMYENKRFAPCTSPIP